MYNEFDALVCQKCGGDIRYHIEGRIQCTVCGAEMKWVGNTHESEIRKVLWMKNFGHDDMRRLVVGMPNPSEYYSREDFVKYGYVGIYEAGRCECDFCKEMRRLEREYWLDGWRRMNDRIVALKEV